MNVSIAPVTRIYLIPVLFGSKIVTYLVCRGAYHYGNGIIHTKETEIGVLPRSAIRFPPVARPPSCHTYRKTHIRSRLILLQSVLYFAS